MAPFARMDFPCTNSATCPHGVRGFHWTDVDENAPNWTFEQYVERILNSFIGLG